MKSILTVILVLGLASCTTAIRQDLMREGARNPSLAMLVRNPQVYEGKLFILGGVIARTTLKAEGSEIEALYAPVDSWGYPQEIGPSSQRFLAVFTRDQGILDPLVYQKNRMVTIAGVFSGTVPGKIDEIDYIFPLFRVVQIYLEPKRPPVVYYYPAPYAGPPWWGYPRGPW